MKQVELTQGYFALVDDEDYDRVMQHSWHIFPNHDRGFYAVTGVKVDGKATTMRMHRFIMGAVKGEFVDHQNRNGLDNQKGNLRKATRSLNAANSKHRRDRRTLYRGVYKQGGMYRAQIRVNGKLVGLGYFYDPREAAFIYDQKAREHFGQFAQCNFEGITNAA